MRAYQVQYTSCRRGTASGAGFQVRSFTPGVAADELQEITRRGLYVAPPAENEAGMPVALRYYPLASGRLAITHSCSSGTDYSGREGNYMAHTLVFDAKELSLRPLDLFAWPGWIWRLTPAEDTDDVPPPLPSVKIPAVPDRAFDPAAFLAGQAGGRELLTDMAHALFLITATSRRIVIRDTAEAGWRWIACLQRLFPRQHILGLTLSTYQYDVVDCAHVNATVDGTQFSFSDSQMNWEFFMYEPATGRRSSIPAVEARLDQAAREYARQTVAWLIDQPERLEQLEAFFAGYTHSAIDARLTDGLRLFLVTQGSTVLRDSDLAAVADFVADHARPEAWRSAIGALREIMESLRVHGSAADYVVLIRLCLSGAKATGDGSLVAACLSVWRDMFDTEIVRHGRDRASVDAAWSLIEQAGGTADAYRLFLDPGHLDAMARHYDEMSDESLNVVADWLAAALMARGERDPGCCAEFHALAAAALRGAADGVRLTTILQPLANKYVSVASILSAAFEIDKTATAEAMIALFHRDRKLAASVRGLLANQGLTALLFMEYEQGLAAARDKRQFHLAYGTEVFAALPAYHARYLTAAAERLWPRLNDDDRLATAREWIAQPETSLRLPAGLSKEVAFVVNRHFTIRPDRKEPLADSLADFAKQLKLSLRPDRPLIRRHLVEIWQRKAVDEDAVAVLVGQFDELDDAEYKIILQLVMKYAGPVCGSLHMALSQRLFRPGRERIFVEEYLRSLANDLSKAEIVRQLAEIAAYWLALDGHSPMAKVREPITDDLAQRVAACRERDVRMIVNKLHQWNNSGPPGGPLRQRTSAFEKAVSGYQTSLMGKIRSLGRGMLDRITGWND